MASLKITQFTSRPGKGIVTMATLVLAIARQLNENVRLLLRIPVISLYCY